MLITFRAERVNNIAVNLLYCTDVILVDIANVTLLFKLWSMLVAYEELAVYCKLIRNGEIVWKIRPRTDDNLLALFYYVLITQESL